MLISLQLSSVASTKVYFEHDGFNNQWRFYPIWLVVGAGYLAIYIHFFKLSNDFFLELAIYIHFFKLSNDFFLNSAEEKERMEWQRSLEAKKNESLGKKETEVCANNPILVYKHPEFL